MTKTKEKIESSLLFKEKLPQFFSQYIENIDQLSPEKIKLFELLTELASKSPSIPFESYLQEIFLLLRNVDKSFIEMRESRFFAWLFRYFSEIESKKQFGITTECCELSSILHEVAFTFQSKKVLGLLIYLGGMDPALMNIEKAKKIVLESKENIFYVEGSSFHLTNHFFKHSVIYFEIQKNEESFSKEEMTFFETTIPSLILDQIEKIPSPLILPSNRELLAKSFRWIINEISLDDLPHIFLDFSRQTRDAYTFSGLICRVKKPGHPSLQNYLKHPNIEIEASINLEEKEFIKEGITITIEIPACPTSTAIDARREIAALIESLIGPFRDVNGGLLEKVEENFQSFCQEVDRPLKDLKSFFYSISPQENQATAPISFLKALYLALEKHKKSEREIDYDLEENETLICITIKFAYSTFEKEFKSFLLKYFSNILIASTETEKSYIVSCVLQNATKPESEKFKNLTHSFYQTWLEKKEVKQVLKICSKASFSSFDPRIGIDDETSHLHKMLFEGLMRINDQGVPENAIAEKVEISLSGLHYKFFLKKSFWSNGTPLTAHDFAHSWKMNLHPDFQSPLDYLLYCIENAKEVKEGILPMDAVGINVINDYLLEIRLSYPIPYFLELCAHSTLSPISQTLDLQNPSWPKHVGKHYISNGPFKFDKTQTQDKFNLVKNPYYWDNSRVHLEKISILFRNEQECLNLFHQEQIEGLLNPFFNKMIPCDENSNFLQLNGRIHTFYLNINCLTPPFTNRKIRQALSLAINRNALASLASENSVPHYSLYSPYFSTIDPNIIEGENLSLARQLFSEGLNELKMNRKEVSNEKIYVTLKNKPFVELLIQQINSAFNLNWELITEDPLRSFFLLNKGQLNISIYRWVDRILDPSYFLETFISSKQIINRSFWTSKELQDLIKEIQQSFSAEKRKFLHTQAERLLYHEKPMIPLFYTPMYSLIHRNVHNVFSNQLQEWDLRHSYKSHFHS